MKKQLRKLIFLLKYRASVVTLDEPRPRPQHTLCTGQTRVRVVEGEPIFYAGIAITNLCNLTCKHCYATSADSEFRDELDTAEALRSTRVALQVQRAADKGTTDVALVDS